jgi:hypothetical protein
MLVVGVIADGYQERCVFLGGREPLPAGYTLKLPRGSRIGGLVRDTAGNPVADAAITIQFYGTGDHEAREFQRERPGFPEDFAVAKTDAQGRWSFGSASETNGDFRIQVKHPDFSEANFHTDADELFSAAEDSLKVEDLHAGTAVMVLKSGLLLRGVVTDEVSRSVAGATVSFGKFFSPQNPNTTTAADGSFALHNLSAGGGYVTVTAPGLAPERTEVEVGTNTPDLAIQLKPAGLLRLRVVDEAGNPEKGVDVRLQGWRGYNTLEWGGATDERGQIEWTSAPLDELDLFAGKEGFYYSRKNLMVADGQEHTITLRRELVVSGTVTDAQTKQPISSFKAIPGSDGQTWARLELAQGTNGQYRLTFHELWSPPQVRFEADGYEPQVSAPLDPAAMAATYDMALTPESPTNVFQGLVLLPDGNAAAQVEVALCTTEKGVLLGKGRFLDRANSILSKTDDNGRFSFPARGSARAVAAIFAGGYGHAELNQTNRELVIQLEP